MALSKSRGNKRSSSTSYVTTTTVIFIALCVLGVWMLTTNFNIPPQNNAGQASKNVETRFTKSSSYHLSTDTNIFDDNSDNLPDDAIKSDKPHKLKINNRDKFSEEKTIGIESLLQESHDNQKSIDDHEQQKQKEGLTQISEESSFTQSQQAVQTQEEINEPHSGMAENEKLPANKIQENMKINSGVSSDIQNEEKANKEQLLEDEGIINPLESEIQKSEKQKIENHGIIRMVQNQDANKMNQKGAIQQRQQPQQEDQKSTQEPTNEVSEDDQKKRVEEHKHQKQQNSDAKSKSDNVEQDQSSKHEFTDVTNQAEGTSQENQQQTIRTHKKGRNSKKKTTESNLGESLPEAVNAGIPKESKESKKSWSTQSAESENEKERRNEMDNQGSLVGIKWQLCNVTTGPDYIPCLDNEKTLKHLNSTKHFEHRERHCPKETPTCLIPTPLGYKRPIPWPQSRDKIWYHNVPHTLLAKVKGHQNWVKVTGEFLTFPGGGTQFIHGALHYIDFIQQSVPGIAWGKHTRVILDVGCGVASFGGFLFDRDVVTMSFAPKDEHEAQVQFALERGIPAISAVMGSQRLPFPSRVFDIVHCARCRVPWHIEGGRLLLELNRVLRPGGYFVWSATPVYQKLKQDVKIWKEMSSLTASMCWELVTIQKDKLNSVSVAIYRKPTSNQCYYQRKQNQPPMCNNDDDPNAAWYVPLQSCMHEVPVDETERGTKWPVDWPQRLQTPPYWLNSSQMGIYGKPAPEDFATDYKHWKRVVNGTYITGLGITWSNVRNVMDMRAVYGGFAAALRDLPIWVMNVVNVDSPDTLPIIYERGLFGIYHDWCESFSTYPRTYDLLHADHLFSRLKKRCKLPPVMAEVDRIVRPGGILIVCDESHVIGEVDNLLKSMHWEVHLTFTKNQEGILSAQKGDWQPNTFVESS